MTRHIGFIDPEFFRNIVLFYTIIKQGHYFIKSGMLDRSGVPGHLLVCIDVQSSLEWFYLIAIQTTILLKVDFKHGPMLLLILGWMSQSNNRIQNIFSPRCPPLSPAFTRMMHKQDTPARSPLPQSPALHWCPLIRLILLCT